MQLVLTGDELSVVGRRLHYDFVRYFGIGNTVICMYQVRVYGCLRQCTPAATETDH
jgi:hypothetical protein